MSKRRRRSFDSKALEPVEVAETEQAPLIEDKRCIMCGAALAGCVYLKPRVIPNQVVYGGRRVGPLCESHVDEGADVERLSSFVLGVMRQWDVERNVYDLGASGTWGVTRDS